MTTLSNADTWLELYGNDLYRHAFFRVHDADLAEDLVQETLLAALKAREGFAGHSSEKTWLIGILKHKIIDHFRKSKREQLVDDIAIEADRQQDRFDASGHWKVQFAEWHNPDKSLEQQQFWEIFNICIKHLPARLAELYTLRELNDLPTDEVCKLLDISTTNNMWVMLSRARMRLRDCLENGWFNPTSQQEQ